MVPFIDVMLVLLIIFMITAPILQSGIEVNLPKTKTVKEISEARMVVTIDRGQRVYLATRRSTFMKSAASRAQSSRSCTRMRCTCAATRPCPSAAWATVVDTLRQARRAKRQHGHQATQRAAQSQ